MSEDDEILEEEDDCPEALVKLFDASKSDWRKAVINEFIWLHDWKLKVTQRLEKIEKYEKIIIAILGVIAGLGAGNLLPEIFKALSGLV